MEKEVMFFYDNDGDTLDVSIGKPQKALTEEVFDDVFVRTNKKNEIVGFMILNLTKGFLRQFKSKSKPIIAKVSE